MVQLVKNLPAIRDTQEMRIRSPGWEDPLEEEMTIHSSILALNNPMDRAAWWAAFQSCKELDMTEQLSMPACPRALQSNS